MDYGDDLMKDFVTKPKEIPNASDILGETQIVLCNCAAFDLELFSKVE